MVDRALLARRVAAVRDAVGALDWLRIHAVASEDLDDLLEFCAALARQVQHGLVN